MKNIILLTFLVISVNSFGQQTGIKESFQKSIVKLDENSKRMSLKEFVENIYISSLNTFEGEKIIMNRDELTVAIKNKSVKLEPRKLKDLNDISVDQVKSFEYKKDDVTTALFGAKGEMFGIVVIQLK